MAHADAVIALAEMTADCQPTIGTYLAIGTELDPQPLSDQLVRRGAKLALPVIVAREAPLVFRAWCPDTEMTTREWGIREPGSQSPEVAPRLLLVPLLLADHAGYRLGYGGGYYDRTLEELRSVQPTSRLATSGLVTIGIGFAEQLVDAVPRDAFDQRLDYLLTPDGLVKFH